MRTPLLSFILILLASLPSARAAVPGDVDGDGKVTVRDAIIALRMAALGEGPEEAWLRADVWPSPGPDGRLFGDGSVTVGDVKAILRMAVSTASSLPDSRFVVTLAGGFHAGSLGGGASHPLFSDPYDIALEPGGDLLIADASGEKILRLARDGGLTAFCGSGRQGNRDGSPDKACFHGIYGISIAPDGTLYVADRFNHSIRRVHSDGTVETVAGTGRPGYRDGPGLLAQFNEPQGIRVDSHGVAWVADSSNHRIRRLDPDGAVTTVAGNGHPGFIDGPALQSEFNSPSGVLPDPEDGSLWIADTYNHSIRRLLANGQVVTMGGDGRPGLRDGPLSTALFFRPYGFSRDLHGNLYVADWGNAAVREIDPSGTVRTIAGNGIEGFRDGPALSAELRGLMNVAVGDDGRLFLTDTDNQRIAVVLP